MTLLFPHCVILRPLNGTGKRIGDGAGGPPKS